MMSVLDFSISFFISVFYCNLFVNNKKKNNNNNINKNDNNNYYLIIIIIIIMLIIIIGKIHVYLLLLYDLYPVLLFHLFMG